VVLDSHLYCDAGISAAFVGNRISDASALGYTLSYTETGGILRMIMVCIAESMNS